MADSKGTLSIKPKLILFDVYETLLDVSTIKSRLNDVLHSKRAYRVWLELCMQYAFVDVITGEFHKFKDLSGVALESTSKILGEPVNEQLQDEIFTLMKHSPLHEEVQEGLSALRDLGFQLAALSNVSADVLRERMEATGLISYFDFILSGEDTALYKPASGAYAAAAKKAGLPAAEILMVTAHWWDVRGAAAAGLQTAFMQRSSQYPEGPMTQSLFAVEDIAMLAEVMRVAFVNKEELPYTE